MFERSNKWNALQITVFFSKELWAAFWYSCEEAPYCFLIERKSSKPPFAPFCGAGTTLALRKLPPLAASCANFALISMLTSLAIVWTSSAFTLASSALLIACSAFSLASSAFFLACSNYIVCIICFFRKCAVTYFYHASYFLLAPSHYHYRTFLNPPQFFIRRFVARYCSSAILILYRIISFVIIFRRIVIIC